MGMRVAAAVFASLVMVICLFFTYSYYQGQLDLLFDDPAYAAKNLPSFMRFLFILGSTVIALIAILLYMSLTINAKSKKLAYSVAKDISSSRDRLRKFYELSPVPYLVVDKNGTIDRPNKASLRFFGVTEEQLLGKQLFDLMLHPEHKDKVSMYREQVRRNVPIEQKELQVRVVDGAMRWVLFSAEDLSEPNTRSHTVLVTLVDIHEQKELERIKTEFLSLASHQLRAPLANLKWYIDFLLKRRADSLTEEVAQYLNKMYRRNEEMIDLVNTLLNLSRVEMGRLKVETERTDIVVLIESVIEEVENSASEKQITMHTSIPPTFLFATDKRLLRVIVQNLLTNALRYTTNGGDVYISMSGSDKKMSLVVRDTGVGIPPEEQGRIFSKMYRATNAQAMEANGNGIGLYMCKALSEAMGGTIDFTSALGKGTTFTITL